MAEPNKPEDDLRTFWEDVRGQPVPEPDLRHLQGHPGELVIGTQGRVLVRIQPDGQLRYGEGYTPDEAAEEFWTAMALKRAGMQERLMHLGILEQMLTRLGRADIRCERARIHASRDEATAEDNFVAERTMAQLESLVHQIIELGRGLALRQGEEPPQYPDGSPAPPPQTPPAAPQTPPEGAAGAGAHQETVEELEARLGRPLAWDEVGFP